VIAIERERLEAIRHVIRDGREAIARGGSVSRRAFLAK
jgi:hypothetical protein